MRKRLQSWYMTKPGYSVDIVENVFSEPWPPEDWIPVQVPGTIVGHCAEAGLYDDPCTDRNMQTIPGYKKDAETHFAFHDMPEDSPFRKPFWYATEFEVGEDKRRDRRYYLMFKGINFQAEVWLNGKRVAAAVQMSGPYRQHKIDITCFTKRYRPNRLAVKITAQRPDDLGITFIDWSPVPPDDSAGIWRPVELLSSGPVSLEDLFFDYTFRDDSLQEVFLAPKGRVVNRSDAPFSGELSLKAGHEDFTFSVSLAPWEEQDLAEIIKEVLLSGIELWWSRDMGSPSLTTVRAAICDTDGVQSDAVEKQIGFRTLTSRINEHGARIFTLNGRDMLIRGSAWSPRLLLDHSHKQDEIDIAYLCQMNFNTVRLEGKLASDYFWDLCDREGILVLAGWPCCTHWEQWRKWKPDDYHIARESLVSQLLRLRDRPSLAAWFYGSDFPPIPPVERMYLSVLDAYAPKLERLSSAAEHPSAVTGNTGVKMSGPYGYVPPVYWYDESMPGHADSFNTETGPDSSFPRFESVCKMITDPAQRWVGSPTWNHHAGLASFLDTEVMNTSLEKRYGVSRKNLKLFLQAAQWNSYEAWRAMYEAYGRNYPAGTGVIGWMLNGHWPSLIWQKYDYYNLPTGGFYGAQRACEPTHVQYSYDDGSIRCLNFSDRALKDLRLQVQLCTAGGEVLHSSEEILSLDAGTQVCAGTVQLPRRKLLFLFLELHDTKGDLISRNVYWLSGTTKDTLVHESTKETWFYRPLASWSDFSALRNLPKTGVQGSLELHREELQYRGTVRLENTGEAVAFAVQADLRDAAGQVLTPVFWDDNLITLRPGEVVEPAVSLPVDAVADVNDIYLSLDSVNSASENA
ncbi:MAG: glycosyl hydrolase 2 galactose-binding domain-containing protein [Fibrobacterota bacterium]